MNEPALAPCQNTAGVTWAWLGWVTLVLTAVLVGWVRFEVAPPTWVFVCMAIGGSLTALILLIALARGFHGRKKLVGSASQPVSSKGIRLAIAGLACLLVIGCVVGFDSYSRVWQEQQWVAEAQAAVELHFQKNLEPQVIAKLGDFQNMTGEGYWYPVWNIQGYHYLTAPRTAHFANVSVPIRIYVKKGTSSQKVVIQQVEFGDYQILYVSVSHPALKE